MTETGQGHTQPSPRFLYQEEPMRALRTIEMSGDNIPVRCNLGILEQLQNEFGSVQEFIGKIAPLDDNGNLNFEQAGADWLPDMHALVYSLPLLVNEGIEVYNENHKIQLTKMTPKEIFRRCDQPVFTVSAAIYSEVLESMRAPKPEPLTETTRQQQ